ncbi:hypothetical protein KAW18_18015, partial [candidate division WOR-3 bacterium]|nr:hypothetical protein [candidate division WOR-3 bacterium]
KDDLLVYGPRELTVEEKRNQVLYWDGMGNEGDTLDPERSPFEGELKLRYREVRGEEGVAKEEFSTNLISVAISNLEPSHKKIIAVKGDKLSFEYGIESSPIPIVKREVVIVDKDHHLNEPIFREELTEDEGTFEWDGKCNEDLWGSEYNKKGHYADPRLNPYRIGMNITIEGEDRDYEVELIKDIDIVPEIVKVIGTHTPFAANASCDGTHPKTLTHKCVIKGKIDNSGDEEEDILYYTGGGEPVEIWNGRDYYKNDAGYNSHGTRYWIELLDKVKPNTEQWSEELGEMQVEWELVRGPVQAANVYGWEFNNTYQNPRTYVYKIKATNKVEENTIQERESPLEKVVSSPENVPSGTIENIQDCYMVHLKGVEDDAYGWAQSLLSVPFNDQSPYPRDYHGTDCSGLIHISEFLKRWKQQSCVAHTYVTNTLYSSAVGEMNPDDSLDVERCDWAGIDEKIDMDEDGKVGEDPPGDMNGDGYPGEAGTDDDNDGLIDEDSRGRQPGESGYSNDLAEDDDEDGYYDSNTQEIEKLNEDPGGFDNKWDHVIMLENYSWWNTNDYPEYKKTLGHKYDFIHASPGPGWVSEVQYDPQDVRYPIIHTFDYPYSSNDNVYNIFFREPNRQIGGQ